MEDEALTLGRAVAGLHAYSKGVSLGLFQSAPREVRGLAEKAYVLQDSSWQKRVGASEVGDYNPTLTLLGEVNKISEQTRV